MFSPRRSVALLLAVALLFAGGWFAGQQYVAATTYEQTTGTVQSAEMETTQHVGRIHLGGNRYYRPNVTYSYRVEGQNYTSRNVAIGGEIDTNARDRAAEVLGRYSTGERVTVYYDPDSPENAYLSQRFSFFPGGVLFGAGLLLLGDVLTPRTRVIGFVLSRIPLGPEGRTRRKTDRRQSVPDDPTAILGDADSSSAASEPTDSAPLTGRAAQLAWLAVGLGILALVVGFVAASRPPYDETALFTGVGAVLAFGRGAYQSLLG